MWARRNIALLPSAKAAKKHGSTFHMESNNEQYNSTPAPHRPLRREMTQRIDMPQEHHLSTPHEPDAPQPVPAKSRKQMLLKRSSEASPGSFTISHRPKDPSQHDPAKIDPLLKHASAVLMAGASKTRYASMSPMLPFTKTPKLLPKHVEKRSGVGAPLLKSHAAFPEALSKHIAPSPTFAAAPGSGSGSGSNPDLGFVPGPGPAAGTTLLGLGFGSDKAKWQADGDEGKDIRDKAKEAALKADRKETGVKVREMWHV